MSLVRRGVVVAPSAPPSLRRLKGRYPRGFSQVCRMGWNRLLGGLGPNQEGISTPLCVKFHPVISILERTKIVGDVFEHSISTLQQRPSNPPPDFGSCSLLPHISISIFGRELLALLDSGSEVTCINEEEFSALSSGRRIATLPVSSTFIRGATGHQSHRIKTQAWLQFSIGSNFLSSAVFLVVKNLVRPVILGMDWLNSTNASLHFQSGQLRIHSGGRPQNFPFQVESAVSGPEPALDISHASIRKNTDTPDLAKTITPFSVLEEKVRSIASLDPSQQDLLLTMFSRHQTVFNELPGRTDKYVHVIQMHDTTPFVRKAYPIAFSLRPEVERVINQMLELGVIKREASPFASPMTVVRKKDGSVRICLDARWANKQMVADCEAPRPPEDLLQSFQSIRFMSTIDLRASYWQIPLSPESTQYTAFLFNGQSYTYQVLPFGLKTAVGSFSRAMDLILGPEVRQFTVNYIDDLLIVSNSFDQHLLHLDMVLTRLRDAKLTINLEKSSFLQEEVRFLGHILSSNGIATDPDKIKAIQEFPAPKTQKHLRAFLGVCGYYRRFSDRYSDCIAPLTRLLRKGVRWIWSTTEQEAFDQTKQLFLDTVMLKFPDFKKVFYLQTDGSGVALGVELYQLLEDGEHGVVGFASRLLRGPELLYTVTEKELLAIIFGLQKYRTILLGHRLVIRTDHYALKFLKQCRLLNDRLTRWSLLLNEFDYEVEHIPGKQNVVADALSRYPYESSGVPVRSHNSPVVATVSVNEIEIISALFTTSGLKDLTKHFRNLRSLQLEDAFLGPLFRARLQGKTHLRENRFFQSMKIHQDLLIFFHPSDGQPRLPLPEALVDDVIQTFHEQYGHFGVSKIFSLIRRYFFFPKMRVRIERIVKSCDLCQKSKFPNRALSGEMHSVIAEKPGDLVTVDYYGPLPQSRSRVAYIFVVIDAFSKFVKLYPLRRAQAKISAKKIVEDFHRTLPVKVVLSDHGTQFQSKHWQETLQEWGIQPTLSSIRHPQSNPTERVMKELSRLFRAYCHDSHANWHSILPNIELLFNVTPHLSTGFSPYEIISGKNPPNPLTNLIQPLLPAVAAKPLQQIRIEALSNLRRAANQRKNSQKNRCDVFQVGDFVLLRENPISDVANKIYAKFSLLYSGPYVVSDRPHPNVYTLRDPVSDSTKGRYNITNLKLYSSRQ